MAIVMSVPVEGCGEKVSGQLVSVEIVSLNSSVGGMLLAMSFRTVIASEEA
jgi:hypothetical protein